ncbi:hypothetical protein PPL_10612 [Heterostelium album PN500]|uniref:Uncharacterized protein n=1 Tax=Heterostelium pallidum (strain ATCC 26659 / Pp 5 / PN500) TaxID=670386 RepID=D3BRK1_HETP5|nr:hypothetical protein PPL_10612 [Heterostelium album PN500]EFA76033.1 hypothetical protein PPL_10612 [Heterostelium album PN500]|eukprot:XP_020428167.1 hypothetical protein PPL_10612 [Heterostelium album PN500]
MTLISFAIELDQTIQYFNKTQFHTLFSEDGLQEYKTLKRLLQVLFVFSGLLYVILRTYLIVYNT